MAFTPVYRKTLQSGALREKVISARKMMSDCRLCPRQCGADRLAGEKGLCRTADQARLASYQSHFGEEAPLVGWNGSGTIFFGGCNLLCCFCQNFEISHGEAGLPVSDSRLAAAMLELAQQGCHNINLVTPSHVVPQILGALEIAAEKGLRLPLVYNSGGYDDLETLQFLEGVVDIYMPDVKFFDPQLAQDACAAADYGVVVKQALREMHRQVGDLVINEDGLACSGLLVRHLVLPENLAGTREIMAFIAEEISRQTYVNVMSQYRPRGRAQKILALSRAVSPEEYRQALDDTRAVGLQRLDG